MVNPRGRKGGKRIWVEEPVTVAFKMTREEADELAEFAKEHFPNLPRSEVVRNVVRAVVRGEHELRLSTLTKAGYEVKIVRKLR